MKFPIHDLNGINLSEKNPATTSRFNLDLESPLASKFKTILNQVIGDGKLKQRLKTLFYKKPVQSKPEAETVQQLKNFFRADIEQLEQLTGLSLQSWK